MQGAGPMGLDADAHSWYVVANSTGSANWRNPVGFKETGYRLEVNGNTRNYAIYGLYPNNFNTSLPAERWQMIELISGESSCDFYGNGQVLLNSAARTSMQGNSHYSIGARNNRGSAWWTGDLAEVIVYNLTQDSMERFAIETYLAIRYGISIPVNSHLYYRHLDHPYNLAGIGRDEAKQGFSQTYGKSIDSTSRVSISNPTQLEDGEYLVWGHNGDTLAAIDNTPAGFPRRFARTWRVSHTGDVGKVDINFDLTGLGLDLSDPDQFALLIDNDKDFSDAQVIGNAYFIGTVIHFEGVSLKDAAWFSLAISGQSTAIAHEWQHIFLKVIPNPVSNATSFKLQFQSLRNGKATLKLLDARGRIMLSKEVLMTNSQQELEISTEKWPRGLYIIHLFDGISRGATKVLLK